MNQRNNVAELLLYSVATWLPFTRTRTRTRVLSNGILPVAIVDYFLFQSPHVAAFGRKLRSM